jgi:excinuclease UvrABC nuclease subunit
MPFSQLIPRRLLPEAVKKYAPSESGVYGVSNAQEWIYIGESDNIQAALLDHLAQFDTPLMKHQPTGFVFEICDPTSRWARLDRLVSEYAPRCNQGLAQGRV